MQKINFSVYPPLKKLLDYLYSIQKKRRLWTRPAGVRVQKVQRERLTGLRPEGS